MICSRSREGSSSSSAGNCKWAPTGEDDAYKGRGLQQFWEISVPKVGQGSTNGITGEGKNGNGEREILLLETSLYVSARQCQWNVTPHSFSLSVIFVLFPSNGHRRQSFSPPFPPFSRLLKIDDVQ